MSALSLLRNKAELAAYDGALVHVIGIYYVISGSPRPLAHVERDGVLDLVAVVKLADKTFVQLEDRPQAELAALDTHCVIATGRLEVSPPLIRGMAQPVPQPTSP